MGTYTGKVVSLAKRLLPDSIKRDAGAITHATIAVGAAIGLVYLGVPWFVVAPINAVAWFIRENAQTSKKIKYWSTHKHIEWIAPSLTGTIAAYVTNILI